jgi:hypothetical protein
LIGKAKQLFRNVFEVSANNVLVNYANEFVLYFESPISNIHIHYDLNVTPIEVNFLRNRDASLLFFVSSIHSWLPCITSVDTAQLVIVYNFCRHTTGYRA